MTDAFHTHNVTRANWIGTSLLGSAGSKQLCLSITKPLVSESNYKEAFNLGRVTLGFHDGLMASE